MQTVTTIGPDIAKSVFQVHGTPARWGWRELSRSGLDRVTDRGSRRTGSNSDPAAPAVKREAEEDWANKKWDSVGPAISGFPAHDTQSREKGFKCGDLFLVGDFYCFAHHAA